jgi:hypothetical protein
MALFAYRHYNGSPLVTIQHVLGNQNFDGVVSDRRTQPESIRYLEATTTLMSYEGSLRMELLTANGHAPAYGRVTAQGSKSRRTAIIASGIFEDHENLRAEHLQRVRDAVERKAGKSYEPGTALAVAVDDSVPFRYPDDIEALDHLVRTELTLMLAKTNFCILALEGSQGLHLCYPVG